MAEQSILAKLGLRTGQLGTSSSLSIAFPLSNGNYDPAALTDATRIGFYADRTTNAEKIGFVVKGSELVSVAVTGVTHTVTVISPASTTSAASLNVPHGSAPASPNNGDIWTTTSGLFARINGATVGPYSASSGISGTLTSGRVPFSNGASSLTDDAGLTYSVGSGLGVANALTVTTAKATFAACTTSIASINLVPGTAPTSPANGDLWATSSGTFFRSGSATQQMHTGSNAFGAFSGALAIWSSSNNLAAADGINYVFDTSFSIAGTRSLQVSTYSGAASGASYVAKFTSGTVTGMTASTEAPNIIFDMSVGRQFNTGSLTTQREIQILAPTYNFVAASTITTAATLAVSAAPSAGTNATITNAYALWVQAGISQLAGAVNVGGILTVTGETVTAASTTGTAGLNVPHGAAPTSPVNGDVWTTTTGLFARINGSTVGPFTGGGLSGSLTSGRVPFANSSSSLTDSATHTYDTTNGLAVDLGAGTAPPAILTGTVLRVGQSGTVGTGFEGISYASTGLSLRGRGVGGTRSSPSATTASLVEVVGYGYANGAYTTSASAKYTQSALNSWSSSDQSTIHTWAGTPSASTTVAEWMRLQNANLLVGTTTDMSGITGGATINSLLLTAASTTSTSGLRVPHGSAPTSPTNGDIWTTTTGVFARVNGVTSSFTGGGTVATGGFTLTVPAAGTAALIGASQTFSGANTFTAQQVIDLSGTSGTLPTQIFASGTPEVYVGAVTNILEGVAWGGQGLRLIGRLAGGSRGSDAATPTALQLVTMQGYGHNGTTWTTSPSGYASVIADGLWSGTNNGAYHVWFGTPNASTTAAEWMRLQSGNLLVGTTVALSGITGGVSINSLLLTAASTTSTSGLRVPHGSAPTSPTNGDIWTTTSGLFGQINGATVGPYGQAGIVDVFSTVGTSSWTKRAGVRFVQVIVLGAGCGGGSGGLQAAGTAASAGQGGGGGDYLTFTFPAAILNSTESVVISDGGAGGAAVSTNSTAGNAGSVPTITSFGTSGGAYLASRVPASATTGQSDMAQGGGAVGTTGILGGPGGTAGATISAANVAGATADGRFGFNSTSYRATPTTRTISAGTAGANGVNVSSPWPIPGSSGGGGDTGDTGATINGGNGGTGGYGAGGGGGGGARNGKSSGAGGKGGQGIIAVISYF